MKINNNFIDVKIVYFYSNPYFILLYTAVRLIIDSRSTVDFLFLKSTMIYFPLPSFAVCSNRPIKHYRNKTVVFSIHALFHIRLDYLYVYPLSDCVIILGFPSMYRYFVHEKSLCGRLFRSFVFFFLFLYYVFRVIIN